MSWLTATARAQAAGIEFSLSGGYNRTNYDSLGYHSSRRAGGSFGFHFSDISEIEFAYQDVVARTKIDGYEDTTLHDRIYSVQLVQGIVGKKAFLQPYIKVGVGQLNRESSGTYGSVARPTSKIDKVTGVAGFGLRIFITRQFALRGEATSYLEGGNIS